LTISTAAQSKRSGRHGIGFYLIALIVLATVPLVLIAGVLVARQSALQRQAFEKSLLQTALALSVAVDRQLDSYRVMLETLAQSEDLQPGRMEAFYTLSARAAAKHGAVFVSLFDSRGTQIFNTLRPAGEALPTPLKPAPDMVKDPERPPVGDPSFLKQVFETGKPATSNLTYGLVAQRLIFVVNIPVLREGKVAYVLNAAFEPAVMTRLLQENPEFSGVPAVIFDRNGFIVGRWQAADKFVGRRTSAWRNNQMSADSGVGIGTTLEGIRMYFSYTRSPVTGWGVNIGTPLEQLQSAVQQNWLTNGLLAAGGLALGVLLALMLAARLRKSIVGLADAASRGEPPRVEGLATREIAQLQVALAESADAREAQARERESRLIAEARGAEAAHANRLKDRFIAVLSHELRNPLAPVRNAVPLLRALRARHDPATMQTIVDMLDRQTAQLTRLVNDLLDVSRISSGRIEVMRERLDLRSVARHAVETLEPGLERRRHRLTSDLPQHPVDIVGDHVRLSQVVSNLLDNAVKFTPDGGEIGLRLHAEAGHAVLSVRDNGSGIPAELQPQIFTAFGVSEAQPAHSRAGGLGLGLSIAKTLAELHGGSLEAHSAGPGQGSEFILRLPLAPGVPDDTARKPASAAVPARGRRVLIVDDNTDAAAVLSGLLAARGHDTRVVHDGDAALACASAFKPHLVLLDISMPGLDGYQVARLLRAIPGLAELKIAAVTGWGQETDRAQSREAGFDLHLVKPVELHELLRALGS
jgi:signal transduction histidine kinase